MSDSTSAHDPVEELVEEFAARYRRGERPSVTEYTDKYPELAEQIREIFPALLVMEQFGSVVGPPTGPFEPAAAQSGPLPGQLGDYRILREVGRGGMGVVYEAVQESLGRHVALKILPFHRLMNPMHLERFRREARAAAQLHHTNIVPVFGVGEAEGIHYYAMQFIQGQGLDAVLEEVRRLHNPKGGAVAKGKRGGKGERGGVSPPVCSQKLARDLSVSIAQGLLTGRFQEISDNGDLVCHAFAAPDVVAPPTSSEWTAKACHPGNPPSLRSSERGAEPSTGDRHSELASQTESQYCRSVAQVGVQVAEALAYAHKQHILHRDIKPSNLLLDTQGTVWITDFGLAKAEDSDDLTSSGDIVGTVRFMAPERFQGKADPRSDIYSLGISLYEMLTLRPAFADSDRAQLIERITHQEPASLRKFDPHLPRDLETIVLKAVAKDPADRYATALDLGEDLRRFLADRPIWARRISLAERSWRWCRRNRAVAGLLAAVLLALLLGTIGASFFAVRALAQKERAERLLYYSQIALAQREWQANEIDHARSLLDGCRADLRGWEHAYLRRFFDSPQRTLRGHTGQIRSVAFSPDGKWIVSASWDKTLKLWVAQTGQEIRTFRGHTDLVSGVAFSPDGKWIVSASHDKTLKIWDVQTGKEVRTLRGPTKGFYPVAVSPDGNLIVSGSDGGILTVWDAKSGQQIWRLTGNTGPIWAVAYSPDGTRIASGGWDRTVKLWDAQTGHLIHSLGRDRSAKLSDAQAGQLIHNLEGTNDAIYCVAFSPDGKRLASCGGENTVRVWDAQSGQLIFALKGHIAGIQSVAFSPDGRWIVTASWDRTLKGWDAQTGRQIFTLIGHAGVVLSVAFSPDGRRIVSGGRDNLLKIWDAPTAQMTLTLKGHTNSIAGVAMSPNGKRILSGSWDNTLKLWDAQTGGEIRTFRGHTDHVQCAAISPDGQRILSGSWDKTLILWDAETGKVILTMNGHTEPVSSVAFSPDGQRIVSGSWDGKLKVWDAQTGYEILTLTGHTGFVRSVAFSPDGMRIASGSSDKTVKVWDARTGREILTLKGHEDAVQSVAFSPDGKRLVSASRDTTLRVWEARTGQPLLTLTGHSMGNPELGVLSVAYSPDGRRIVSGCADNTVKVWDAQTGHETLTLAEHTAGVRSVAFSADGTRIVSGGDDRTVKIWDTRPVRRGE